MKYAPVAQKIDDHGLLERGAIEGLAVERGDGKRVNSLAASTGLSGMDVEGVFRKATYRRMRSVRKVATTF